MKHQPILIYLLFTLFVGLKLTGQIGWHWVWVFAPLWGYAMLTFGAGFVIGFWAAYKHAKSIATACRKATMSTDALNSITELTRMADKAPSTSFMRRPHRPDLH